MVASTVRYTIGYLSQAFKAALIDDPRRYQDGSLPFLLKQTFIEYPNKDPGVKQQKYIQIIFLLKLLDLAQTEFETAMADLVCAAFSL